MKLEWSWRTLRRPLAGAAVSTLIAGLAMAPAPAPALAQDASPSVSEVHGLAMHGEPKYAPDFAHFDYVNPDAPKGGSIRLSDTGSFDSINPYILEGTSIYRGILEGRVYETLTMSPSDEAFTSYGSLARTIETDEARTYVTYRLYDEAKWSDGTPVTVDDVIFSFNTLKEKGDPFWKDYFKDIASAAATDDGRVRFDFTAGIVNRELPLITGQFPVLQQAWWRDRDFAAPTLDVPVSSGPYTIGTIDPGRSFTLKRNPDYWGANIGVNVGRYNFDEIRYDYYRDSIVEHEAFKAGEYDFRSESSSKSWATGYDFQAVTDGLVTKETLPYGGASGMYGVIFNERKPMFQDKNVRLALTYAFDFEWSNHNLMYDAYTRTESYFDNSEMAAKGLPAGEELMILEGYKGRIPDEVFTTEYKAPSTGGTEEGLRENLKKATDLLTAAGWTIQDNVWTNAAGEKLKFEIMLFSPSWERIANPYAENLKKLGVDVTVVAPDETVFTERSEQFDYDTIVSSWGASLSPGNEQRNYWTCESAETTGSSNYIGLCDPVVDELVEGLIAAPDRDSLVQRTRALDRVLQWGHHVVPAWHNDVYRVAYWNVLDRPEKSPDLYMDFDTWYYNAADAEAVRAAQEAIEFVEPTEEGAEAAPEPTAEATAEAAAGDETSGGDEPAAGDAGPADGEGGPLGGTVPIVLGLVVLVGLGYLFMRSRGGGA